MPETSLDKWQDALGGFEGSCLDIGQLEYSSKVLKFESSKVLRSETRNWKLQTGQSLFVFSRVSWKKLKLSTRLRPRECRGKAPKNIHNLLFIKLLHTMICPDRLSPIQAVKHREQYSRTRALEQGSFSYGLREGCDSTLLNQHPR